MQYTHTLAHTNFSLAEPEIIQNSCTRSLGIQKLTVLAKSVTVTQHNYSYLPLRQQ